MLIVESLGSKNEDVNLFVLFVKVSLNQHEGDI